VVVVVDEEVVGVAEITTTFVVVAFDCDVVMRLVDAEDDTIVV